MTSPLSRLPRVISIASERTVYCHWVVIHAPEGGIDLRGVPPFPYAGRSQGWARMTIPHTFYVAEYNSPDNARLITDAEVARARSYALSDGPLAPGFALFPGGTPTRKVRVTEGNFRAHASFLRGEHYMRFYVPLQEARAFLRANGITDPVLERAATPIATVARTFKKRKARE